MPLSLNMGKISCMELKQHQQSGSIKSDWANSSVYKITHKGGTEHMEKNNSKMEKNTNKKIKEPTHNSQFFSGELMLDGWIHG